MKMTLADRWNSFWFRTAPPHAQALLRIAFGLYLLTEAATYLPHIPRMFSEQALTFSSWAELAPTALQPLLEPPPVPVAYGIAGAFVLACLGVTAGIAMRTSLAVLILLFLYYWQLSFHLFPSSYHRIYFVLLWVLLISGADRTFSLRMLRTRGSIFAWEPVSIFAQRLLAVQISATYLGVGLQKAWLPAWQDGAVLSYSLINRWATPLGRWAVEQNLPFAFYSASVLGIKIFEFFLPFCLWIPRWRLLFVVLGASFHIGIAVLMSIWWFVALIPAYVVFWQPEEIHAFCRRISRGRIV